LNYLLRCGGFPEVIAPASICPSRRRICYEAVVATGKPVVLVLTNGCALAVNWAKEHVNAILEAWYPGEEGGTPIAETLSGKNNPAGRLPVTFYTSVDQLPSFESYAMKGRTYRYFEGTPLYPFGYGLSYTTFSYSDLTLPTSVITAGQPMTAEVTVTNKGKLAGDEVAQLYLSFPNVAGAPIRALRGFQCVHPRSEPIPEAAFRAEAARPEHGIGPRRADHPGGYSVSVGGGQPEHRRCYCRRNVRGKRQRRVAGIEDLRAGLRCSTCLSRRW
jgi:beta-glucosidase